MVSLLLYDENKSELDMLRALSKDLAALLSGDYWNISQADSPDVLQRLLADSPLMDMLMYDVTPREAISRLLGIRRNYKETQLMMIADVTTSPMEYMKPGIMASSLLLRPWIKDELVPERYFYVAREGAAVLEPVGQYDTGQQGGAFLLETVTEDAMWDIIRESGFQMETANESVPAKILEAAQDYWQEDKDMILRYPTVGKLLQEYDMRTQCKKKQCIKFICGLDTYLVCSDGIEGGERSWY